jgi:thiol:disulfide interchange protein DsbC
MKRLFIIISIFLLFIIPVCACAGNLSPEEKFKKSFPDRKVESITPTLIKGVYEVYTGNELFYYAPEADLLLYGSMVTKEGLNLTRDNMLKKMALKMAQLPLDKALKIGSGKTTIVEFMDPDCSHCRDAYRFFSQRKDVTIYVFIMPLFQTSFAKIKHILCAADPLKMYEEVMQGKFDDKNKSKLNICTDSKVDETIKNNMKFASQIGLKGTPLFYIKGQVLDGFVPAEFEKLLKD